MSGTDAIVRIILGYLAACVTVTLALWVLPGLIGTVYIMFAGRPYPDYSHLTTLLILVIYSVITLITTILLTMLPAMVLIPIAEKLKVRAWWAYMIGAALVGALAYLGVPLVLTWTSKLPAKANEMAEAAALGAICGLVYWFVAVRGRYDDTPLPAEPTEIKPQN